MNYSTSIPTPSVTADRDLRYEISQLLGLAGVKSPVYVPYGINRAKSEPPYILPQSTVNRPATVYTIDQLAERMDDELGKSWMGTPIWFPMTLNQGDYHVYDGSTGEIKKKSSGDFDLPPTMLVDFTRAKTIIKTEVSGGVGTVKELYGFEDWRINMRGFLLDDKKGGTTALDKKRLLLGFENIAESISVTGSLFDDKYIFNIVIEELTIKQVEGKPNVFEFNIDAVSDRNFELELDKKVS